jgi:signal peptidase II
MQNTGREGLALRSPAAWVRFAAIIAAGTALDLWSKRLAWLVLDNKDTRLDDPHLAEINRQFPVVDFLWQPNYGAVFGVGQGKTALFVAFTFLALGLLTWLFADSKRHQVWLQTFLACVVAGAVGNLYDRIQFSCVRDFIRFDFSAGWAAGWGGPEHYIWPYVFNIADVFISVGVCGLFLVWLTALVRHHRAKARDARRTVS